MGVASDFGLRERWEWSVWRAMLKPQGTKDLMGGKLAFRNALVRWFEKNGKDYPWRRTEDPYEILVSEVMLQQTQIGTVLGKGYYTRFLESFPDVEALAGADDARLLKAWEGLGYYRRARMLRDAARVVVDDFGGTFPQELEELLKLPGIGRYTAGAVRAFAFELPAVLVDGNVSRVLSRLMDFRDAVDEPGGIKQIWAWAGELADGKRPRQYHAALMECGQQVCRPGVPDCLSCPVSKFCASRAPEELPVKGRKVRITDVDEHAVWMRDSSGRVLLHHEGGKRRTGLWKLPVRDAVELRRLPVLAEQRYAITRYRVSLRVHDGAAGKGLFQQSTGDVWTDPADLETLAVAAPFRKVIERLLEEF